MMFLLILFLILFCAEAVLLIAERITHKNFETIESIIGIPMVFIGFWIAYCIFVR